MMMIPPNKYKSEANDKLSLSALINIPAVLTTKEDANKMIASVNLSTGIKYSNKAAKKVLID